MDEMVSNNVKNLYPRYFCVKFFDVSFVKLNETFLHVYGIIDYHMKLQQVNRF
jgi:hypothetical protein